MENKRLCILLSFLLPIVLLQSQVSFTLAPSICLNDAVSLTANTGSLSNCTYTWACTSIGASLTSANGPTTNLSFNNPGNYTVTLTVNSGATSASYQNSATVMPLPLILLSQSSATTCIENNFPLFSKPVQLTAAGAMTYTWNPPISAGNPNGPSNTVRPSTTSCFSVTGQDASGCRGIAAVCVSVLPRFYIGYFPASTLVCQPTLWGPDIPTNLNMNSPTQPAFGPASAHTYSWTGLPGSMLTNPLAASIAVLPNATTTYTGEMHDALHCVSLPALITVSVQNCTSLKEDLNDPEVSLFPNPVSEKLYLMLNFTSADLKIELFNALGQKVQSAGPSYPEMDVSSLTPGIYFVSVTSGSRKQFFKIIKEELH